LLLIGEVFDSFVDYPLLVRDRVWFVVLWEGDVEICDSLEKHAVLSQLFGWVLVLQVYYFGLVLEDASLGVAIDVFEYLELRLKGFVLVHRHEGRTDFFVVDFFLGTVKGISVFRVESFVLPVVTCLSLTALKRVLPLTYG